MSCPIIDDNFKQISSQFLRSRVNMPSAPCSFQAKVEGAEKDLEASSRSSFAHGTLLALRFVIEAAPWVAIAGELREGGGAPFKACLHQLLGLVRRVVLATLPVLSFQGDTYVGGCRQHSTAAPVSLLTPSRTEDMSRRQEQGLGCFL